MWADDNCHVSREYENGMVKTYVFAGTCIMTKKPYSVRVPAAELFAYRRGSLIQDAMPSVSRDDREFLISGLSPEGFAGMFGDE